MHSHHVQWLRRMRKRLDCISFFENSMIQYPIVLFYLFFYSFSTSHMLYTNCCYVERCVWYNNMACSSRARWELLWSNKIKCTYAFAKHMRSVFLSVQFSISDIIRILCSLVAVVNWMKWISNYVNNIADGNIKIFGRINRKSLVFPSLFSYPEANNHNDKMIDYT